MRRVRRVRILGEAQFKEILRQSFLPLPFSRKMNLFTINELLTAASENVYIILGRYSSRIASVETP